MFKLGARVRFCAGAAAYFSARSHLTPAPPIRHHNPERSCQADTNDRAPHFERRRAEFSLRVGNVIFGVA